MSAAGNIGQNSSKEAAAAAFFAPAAGPLSTPPVALPVVSFFRLTDSCNMSLFKPRLGFVLACIFLDALGIGLIVPVPAASDRNAHLARRPDLVVRMIMLS